MIVTLVKVNVKSEFIDNFKKACIENHINSVLEPGNLRFDILQDAEDPNKFILYEAYDSEESINKHKQTSHYLEWKELVAPWMAAPRTGMKHHIIAPSDVEAW